MEVQELKKLIKENNIPSFLIFTGEEYEVQRQYIKQIAKVKNLSTYYAEDIDEIWRNLDTQSLFSVDRLYILRDDKELLTNEKIYTTITDRLANNTLILQLTSADKRLKALKLYKDITIEFNTLTDTVLKRHIQKEIELLSDRNCDILIDICENNYGRCLLEVDKLRRYWQSTWDKREERERDGGQYWLNECFKTLLEDGTIYVPAKDRLWDFIDAFLKNKSIIAYEYYQELKEINSPTFAILSNLYNDTRALLQVQTCKSNDIAKVTGLSSWQINNAKQRVNKFATRDLIVILRLIQKIEADIKQGKLDESIAIDYLFTSVF